MGDGQSTHLVTPSGLYDREPFCLLLGIFASNNMTQFSTKSHYPEIELTSPPCSILILPSARLDSNKDMPTFSVIAWTRPGFELKTFRSGTLHSTDLATASDLETSDRV